MFVNQSKIKTKVLFDSRWHFIISEVQNFTIVCVSWSSFKLHYNVTLYRWIKIINDFEYLMNNVTLL